MVRARGQLAGLLVLVSGLVGCRSVGPGRERGEIVISSAWQGPIELRPLGATLAAWQRLSPEEARPPVLANAAEAIAAGKIDTAIDVLNTELCSNPESTLCITARGQLELQLGYLRAAEGDFERVIALTPEDAEAWAALGEVRLSLGLFVLASRALEEAIRLGLDDGEHHVLLARAHLGAGRGEEAAREYLAALERWHIHPRGPFLFQMVSFLGATLSSLGLSS